MYSERCLALFAFDGNIVDCESFDEFLRFTHSPKELRKVYSQLAVKVAGHRLGRVSKQALREAVLGKLYADYDEDRLRQAGKDFAFGVLTKRLRPEAFRQLREHRNQQHEMAVVSSGLDVWLKPWAGKMGMQLICTELAFEEGRFSGRFVGEECSGDEKARRVRESFQLDLYERIYAYGDSKSDMPMLKLADEPNFRVFR